MVQEANIKRAQAEKSFAESEMKVGNLTMNQILMFVLTLMSGRMIFVALLHHQFYSTKMLAIATCETDTVTV